VPGWLRNCATPLTYHEINGLGAATRDDVVIRSKAGDASVDIELARKIVPYDGVGGHGTFVGGGANVNGGDATGRWKEAVLDHGIVRDKAVMDACE
jgi:hypothetical protein